MVENGSQLRLSSLEIGRTVYVDDEGKVAKKSNGPYYQTDFRWVKVQISDAHEQILKHTIPAKITLEREPEQHRETQEDVPSLPVEPKI